MKKRPIMPGTKIIHLVLGKANPNRMNGVNKVVYELATNQATLGREVALWGITQEPVHDYGKRNFETRLFKSCYNPFHVNPKLEQAIKELPENVVFHLHGGWIPVFWKIGEILRKNNIRFVVSPHGAYNEIARQKSKWSKRVYFKFFESSLLEKASWIHCIGESEMLGLYKIHKTMKTKLLPYGFSAANKILTENNSNKGQFIVGFVGRLDIHTKGLDLLMAAFDDFQQREPKAVLWIVGDGAEKVKLEEMVAERNLGSKVILWGSKFGDEKEVLLRKMNVFVHPSRNEGLPASVLEAASLGIPCLVSQATNLAKSIERYQGGISISNNSEQALLEALVKMKMQWDFGMLQQLGINAQKMVQELFDWNKIVNEFDKLYQL